MSKGVVDRHFLCSSQKSEVFEDLEAADVFDRFLPEPAMSSWALAWQLCRFAWCDPRSGGLRQGSKAALHKLHGWLDVVSCAEAWQMQLRFRSEWGPPWPCSEETEYDLTWCFNKGHLDIASWRETVRRKRVTGILVHQEEGFLWDMLERRYSSIRKQLPVISLLESLIEKEHYLANQIVYQIAMRFEGLVQQTEG